MTRVAFWSTMLSVICWDTGATTATCQHPAPLAGARMTVDCVFRTSGLPRMDAYTPRCAGPPLRSDFGQAREGSWRRCPSSLQVEG
jgi:hypothetical protein